MGPIPLPFLSLKFSSIYCSARQPLCVWCLTGLLNLSIKSICRQKSCDLWTEKCNLNSLLLLWKWSNSAVKKKKKKKSRCNYTRSHFSLPPLNLLNHSTCPKADRLTSSLPTSHCLIGLISILQRKIPAYSNQLSCHAVCWRGWTLLVLCPGWPCAYSSTWNLFPSKAFRALPSFKCIKASFLQGSSSHYFFFPLHTWVIMRKISAFSTSSQRCFLSVQHSRETGRCCEAMAKGNVPLW